MATNVKIQDLELNGSQIQEPLKKCWKHHPPSQHFNMDAVHQQPWGTEWWSSSSRRWMWPWRNSFLVGLMGSKRPFWHPKLHATKSHVFNKRFHEKVLKVLEGFQLFWLSHVTFSLQMWKIVQSMWKIWHVCSSQWSLIISIFDIWIKIGIAAGRNDNSMALTMASWVIPQWFKPSHHQRQEYCEAAQANLRKATTDVTRVPCEGGWKDENDFRFHTAYM